MRYEFWDSSALAACPFPARKLGGGKPPAAIRPGAIRSERMRGHRLPRPPRPMPDLSPSVVGESSRVDPTCRDRRERPPHMVAAAVRSQLASAAFFVAPVAESCEL